MNISHDDNVNLDFVRDVILAWSFSIYLLQDDLSRICNTKRITAKVFFFSLQSPREMSPYKRVDLGWKWWNISWNNWRYQRKILTENISYKRKILKISISFIWKHHLKVNFKLKARCICQIQLDLSVSIRVTDTLRIFRKDRIIEIIRIESKKNLFIRGKNYNCHSCLTRSSFYS